MVIKRVDNLETENIGNIESIEANISADSLPFLFDLVTKSFYSDPIGSICREITSNCFDAHKEINSDEAVIVKKSYDYENNCYYIHFIDKGIGLSRERIINIFMNYFSSTKRTSNEFIGGFGIGSKSPLSYQDMFYITSVHDGKEYECILSRGKSKPELDSLNGLETVEETRLVLNEDNGLEEEVTKLVKYPIGKDTDKKNGTEIKLEIKPSDEYTFQKALQKQLCYFDNVYFENWGIDNNYKIIEGETFKYRSKDVYSDIMHIVYGKVCYPIDYRQLKIEEVQIPIAVKFDIGELIVTPNREALIYTEEIKELIRKKIDLCIEELVTLYNKQNPDINNIFEFLEKRTQRPHIDFNGICKLYIPKKYGVENSTQYTPLKGIKIPNNPFFDYYDNQVYGETIKSSTKSIGDVLQTSHYYIIKVNSNKYTNAYLSDNTFLVKENPNTSIETYCEKLGLYYYGTSRRSNSSYKYDFKIEDGRKVRAVPILGKAKIIKAYKDHIRSIVQERSLGYYNDIVVSEEWVKQYKKENKEKSYQYQRKLNNKIIVTLNGIRQEIAIKRLAEPHTLVYCYNDFDDLYIIKEFILTRKSLSKPKEGYPRDTKGEIMFIKIAKTNEKFVKELPNAIYIDDIYTHKKFQKLFINAKTRQEIQKRHYSHSDTFAKHLSKYYRNKLNILQNFTIDTYYGDRLTRKLRQVIDDSPLNPKIEIILKELDKYLTKDKFEIFNYISSNIPDKFLIDIVKNKKILKLDGKWYSSNTPMVLSETKNDFVLLDIDIDIINEHQEDIILDVPQEEETEETGELIELVFTN